MGYVMKATFRVAALAASVTFLAAAASATASTYKVTGSARFRRAMIPRAFLGTQHSPGRAGYIATYT